MKKYFAFLLLAFVTVVSCNSQKQDVLTPKEFKSKINNTVTVLDVRTPGEFNAGHLEGSINLDIKDSQFENNINQLDKSKTVLVYCLSGGRSSRAGQILRKKGFMVQELKGGIEAWQAEGLPVVK